MKIKTKIFYLLLLSGVMASCGIIQNSFPPKIKTDTVAIPLLEEVVNPLENSSDSMSYALGIGIGANILQNIQTIPGGKTNVNLLVRGFSEMVHKDSTLLSETEAQNYFQRYVENAQKAKAIQMKAEGSRFLARNRLNEGVQVTPSGLQYLVLKSSNGDKPTTKDFVKVHYTGQLIDGRVFDSSVDRGESLEFSLDHVIEGWKEGLQLMRKGEKFKFYIPYSLAYGEKGIGETIPPYATLIFEVELLDIIKK